MLLKKGAYRWAVDKRTRCFLGGKRSAWKGARPGLKIGLLICLYAYVNYIFSLISPCSTLVSEKFI
ncbi:hypothetical protein AB434_1708 [Heyndrickxia coagulans]|uniref:Uncharacterized protein n=1 Tax=Heyndrickxia coagulans TaxID=1398 RepID=A0AAN0T8F2_HEYCO|nr:hypothetical protein SB48_HM08orf05771 [Heyndrickxia coagulans]AKN54113.1 hypothetical protein AB434_1708 [Heyndrickxia coagulans]ATW84250.1 hypothetical protein CIW84_15375 [Heyndrickxia coagulans]KGB30401.1 hypothetical protein IE89_05000 [Heyndrickxia coagulans]KXT19429.1 hypothetical protein UZ35_15285 [Heyndrickxia coagulans]